MFWSNWQCVYRRITLHRMDQAPHIKPATLNLIADKAGNTLERIGTGHRISWIQHQYSLQLFNRLPLPIGSSCHILTMSRGLSSPEFPSQHPAVAHWAGHTNRSSLLSYSIEPATWRPEAPTSTSDWQVRLEALIGQRVWSDISTSLKVSVWWKDTT